MKSDEYRQPDSRFGRRDGDDEENKDLAVQRGRRGRVAGTYEMVVAGLPYIIAYSLSEELSGAETFTVLRIIHGTRDWTDLEDACRKSGVTLHGTGIHPGGITERFPLMVSALS